MIATALLLSLVLNQQFAGASDENRISFAAPAGQALQVLKALSKVAGEKMLVSGPISDETLLIAVQDVPLSQLKTKIAFATRAEWKPMKPEGFMLARTSKMEDDLLTAEGNRHIS